ncbi:MAG: hypothetical protein IJZ61_02350 [Oscillospiraceae bacterium]|nr:hypothetical protein [Oscillospiraceae bacterium]
MKLTAKILSLLLISTVFLCGCSEGTSEETTAAETETSTTAEITMAETIAIPTETTTTAATEETTTTATETTEYDTEASAEETSAETYFDMNIPDYETLLADFAECTVTYGNTACGYIQSDESWIYEEVSEEEYSITAPDGETSISVFLMKDFNLDTLQIAYTTAAAVALNGEIEGYEHHTMSEVNIDGMNGYFLVMNDLDTDLGFMQYLTLADEENNIIYNLVAASTDDSSINIIYLSMMFDTFKR